ncbi:MAG: 2-dehydropantoate 2-reductase [Proteobacteria bacterium]|nr:2-dehydropantoate 2-reductase [Pseudomonadota bacterium]
MRICIVGAGAIGGLMGAKLALSGEEVTVVDQGAHLQAIQENGLKLIWEDGTEYVAEVAKATDKVEDAGVQDLIILSLKAHYLEQVAKQIPKITGPDTMIVTVQNGIPWWYFHKHGGEFDGRRIESLDPDGVLGKNIDADRIIGCVVYPAGAVSAPGVIHHVEGDRFPIGELDGSESERVRKLYDLLVNAGFRSRILDDIRSEIWLKAWGNLSFNPISALTHATLADICQFRETRKLAETMMAEAQAIAEKLGITFRHTIEKRISGAEGVGKHKTSMLQDVEASRPLEVGGLIGSVLELGRLLGMPMPHISAVYACTRLLGEKTAAPPTA